MTTPVIRRTDRGSEPALPPYSRPSQNLAAQRLRHLLETEPSARRRWQARAMRHGKGTVNQSAVAQVLAEWMWESGEASEADTLLPRRLKDRVSRALSGEYLPPQTLRLFIDAFDVTDLVAHELWSEHFAARHTT